MKIPRFSRDLCLAVICGGLAAIFGYQRHAPISDYPVPDAPAQELPPLEIDVAPFVPPQRSTFDVVDARFLFSPARAPYVPPPEPVEEPPPPEPPQLSLIGIIAEGGSRIAMVRGPSEPYAVGLRVGTDVDGWEVTEISEEFITLSAQTLEHRVVLNTGSGQSNGN